MKRSIFTFALASTLSVAALARPNDIDADKSKRRNIDDPMDASDCDKIFTATKGVFFPQAHPYTTYKPADCADKIFWQGKLTNADPQSPGFDKLPLCLGMKENIDFYLSKYPGKCRRLTVANGGWNQDINQKLMWCAAKGHFKGSVIWLANNRMMSKRWVEQKLKAHLANPFVDQLFVTASEACFWHKSMGKPFPLSGKEKAAQASASKAAKKPAAKTHGASSSAHP